MKKDVIIIVALVFLILLLGGGIFFAIKTDFFTERDNNITDKKDNNTDEENKKEEVVAPPEEMNPEDKTSESDVKPSNENKPNDDKTKNENKSSNDKTNNDKTNNDKLNNTGGNDTKHENTPVAPPKEDKPVVVDPTIPIENDTMTALVCSIELKNEDNIPTEQIVTIDFYDSTKLPYSIIMTTYMNLASFGYTDSQIKELLNEIKGSAKSIPGFEFGTWQTGSTIELSYSSSASSLRKYYPNEYKIGGEMSYDVTKRDYIKQGYTCN